MGQEEEPLEKEVGPLWPSRIGVIVKRASKGMLKVRLIHDLRRSGVNAKIRLRERLVLPRISNIIESILDLMSELEDEQVELWGMDFRDAFKQLRVALDEAKFLVGRSNSGWFSYLMVDRCL